MNLGDVHNYNPNNKCIGCQNNYLLLNEKCAQKVEYFSEYDDNGCIEYIFAQLQKDGTCKYCNYALDVFGLTCIPKVENFAFNTPTVQIPCLKCENNYQVTEEGTKCVPCESGKTSIGYQCHSKIEIEHC